MYAVLNQVNLVVVFSGPESIAALGLGDSELKKCCHICFWDADMEYESTPTAIHPNGPRKERVSQLTNAPATPYTTPVPTSPSTN